MLHLIACVVFILHSYIVGVFVYLISTEELIVDWVLADGLSSGFGLCSVCQVVFALH